MLRLDGGQGFQYFGEMQLERPLRCIRIARIDGSEDVPVLVDQQGQGGGAGQGEVADAVHMRLDVLHHRPGRGTARTFGDGGVEQFVGASVAVLLLVTYIPALSLWLPGLFH